MEYSKPQKTGRARQSGFTIIEAFIAVAVLAILGSIGINVYYDFTIRTRVSESVVVIGPIQHAMGLHVSESGELPDALSDMDFVSHSSVAFAGDFVSSVDVIDTGVIRVQLKTRDDMFTAAGKSVVFTGQWSMGSPHITWQVSGSVPAKYLPRGDY